MTGSAYRLADSSKHKTHPYPSQGPAVEEAVTIFGDRQELEQFVNIVREAEYRGAWKELTSEVTEEEFLKQVRGWLSSLRPQKSLALVHTITSAFCRAFVFSGQLRAVSEWKRILDHQSRVLSNDTLSAAVEVGEAVVRYNLARAALCRAQNEYGRSYVFSARAVKACKGYQGQTHHLWADAQFSLALSLSYIGRSYEALAIYANVQRARNVSPYRRLMCTLNEAHERMVLGDISSVELLIPDLPPERAFRLRLQLSLLTCNDRSSDELHAELNRIDLPPSEEAACHLLVVEDYLTRPTADWGLISAAMKRVVRQPYWLGSNFGEALCRLYDEVVERNQLPAESFDDLALLSKRLNPKDWNDYRLHRVLCGLALGLDMMDEYEAFSSSLKAQRLSTPLQPHLEHVRSPKFAWHSRIAARMGLAADRPTALVIDRIRKKVVYGDRELDLTRHPKSLEVLLSLASGATTVHKSALHQSLTGSRYCAHLHDSRLRMLLNRLKKLLKESLAVDLFSMPGDHHVHLLVPISIKESP